MKRYVPILGWAPRYDAGAFADDALAAAIVTIMLIPQSLAYALIAGLPPEAGLYASILPLVAYAVFGTSNTLAVGPVAVVSLMTAAAIGRVAETGAVSPGEAALALAFLTGLVLLVFGFLRFGFLANFLSHPIITGFIIASAVIIAASQMKHVLGVPAEGHNLVTVAGSLIEHLNAAHMTTLLIGAAVIAFLVWTRRGLKKLLGAMGAGERLASALAKAGPLLAVVATTGAAASFQLDATGVAVVGAIPAGLPPATAPPMDMTLWRELAAPAFLIAVIGYVESISVAQTLAAKRRETIDLNQEMIGLGAANLAAGVSGGYPVTGGFARSVVNFDAGARTPAAGAFTAVGIALAAMFLTPFLYYLPKATLAATIIVAVLSLIDLRLVARTWRYSKSEFAAMAATMAGVFVFGVEIGLVAGIALSILTLLYKASLPHCAVVGQVPGTEHFRNVDRHQVITSPRTASMRIDGNLFYANARFLENRLLSLVAGRPELKHIVFMCSAVNEIDSSALESLERINQRLDDLGIAFHLSEVKGPVMDRLKRTHFLDRLTGRVFLSQFEAMHALDPTVFHPPNGEGANAAPPGEAAPAR